MGGPNKDREGKRGRERVKREEREQKRESKRKRNVFNLSKKENLNICEVD